MPPSSDRPSPDPLTTGAVGLAVVAVSSSAPLIAYAAAPALAIAFWRNLLAVAVLSPFSLARRRAEFRRLTVGAGRREGLFCVLSGVALAAHFATWVPSAQLTSVAAATALGATQPIWQGLIARAQGRRLPLVVWIGVGVAAGGAVIATGVDVGVSGRAVVGDLLAVTGGIFAAVYTAFGERARASISTTTYTTICYGICALILLVVCLLGGVRLVGFDPRTWLAILALVAGAQLLGHSMFNYALHKISATTVSVLILLEVPGAALLGWAWLGQSPRPYALLGMALLLTGVAVVVLGGARVGRRASPTALPADPAPLDG
ncbi:DMT family transporter [Micromonospora sp. NPDC005298]|uniref:DMT family transporter n=1 Tax=Micromonospora sp. NPDC005298 TaxID=3156873 RepID=UPI0033BF4478